MIRLEESIANELLGQDSIATRKMPTPETARFADVVLEGIGYHEIRMICARYRHESDGSIEILDYKGAGQPPITLERLGQMVLPLDHHG